MSTSRTRTLLLLYLVLLVPVGWLATVYEPFQVDGDAVAYMDLADLIHTHRWAGIVNAYWHPLYPALLALAQVVLHPSRTNELGAYYSVNYGIFLLQLAAMWAFTTALHRWCAFAFAQGRPSALSLDALRLTGLALVVIASQRELSMGKIRPDALLQALLLFAFAAMLQALLSENLAYPALMGTFFGLAYLTKSFAFLIALLSIASVLALKRFLPHTAAKRTAPVLGVWSRPVATGALPLLCFAVFSGPYIAALSHQKGRFDFGDSGALNYAWYSGGVEKMHLEPWMTASFGHASVALKHPEVQLMSWPGVYSYRAEPYGTYPDWFDTTFFNEHITPHLNLPVLLRRDARNVVLVFRYLLNHPEGSLLLLMLTVCGGTLRFRHRNELLWLLPVALGTVMWLLYGLVNIEERYVTLAYFLVLLPILAALRTPSGASETSLHATQRTASAMVALFAVVALAQSVRLALEERRTHVGLPHTWYSPDEFGAASALAALGVRPGDEVACMGTTACLNEEYWARLAGIRILTEVYNPNAAHLAEQWNGLRNRAEVLRTLHDERAKVLVASFDPGETTAVDDDQPGSSWIRLGTTDFYALPLTLAPEQRLQRVSLDRTLSDHGQATATMPWDTHREGGP